MQRHDFASSHELCRLPGDERSNRTEALIEDRKQAEEGLVALIRGCGKVSYKLLDPLAREDVPARVAANRSRTTWLNERRDG